MKRSTLLGTAALSACCLAPVAASAQTTTGADKWRFAADLYAYLPTVDASVAFPTGAGGSISVDAGTILDNLKFTVMGAFEAHNGRWGVFTDLMYLDVGDRKSGSRDFTVGGGGVPTTATADLTLDLKGTIWTIAGEYRIVSQPSFTMDVLAGVRMLSVKPKLGWSFSTSLPSLPSREGGAEVKETNWDGLVGIKGRYVFGDRRQWFVPYYADVGTGDSDLTWQAMAGIGYSHGAWDFTLGWRYLDYDLPSGGAIQDMSFSGPLLGAVYRW